MKYISQCLLEGGSTIFEAKRNDVVCESAPWWGQSCFVLVYMTYLDLIMPWESIHEGEDLMLGASVNYMIDEGH